MNESRCDGVYQGIPPAPSEGLCFTLSGDCISIVRMDLRNHQKFSCDVNKLSVIKLTESRSSKGSDYGRSFSKTFYNFPVQYEKELSYTSELHWR